MKIKVDRYVWNKPWQPNRIQESGILNELVRAANNVAGSCGPGYEVGEPMFVQGKPRVTVRTADPQTAASEAKHHKLARFASGRRT